MKQKINTFYILNLLSVVDGEILESAHVDISKYIQQKGRMLLLMIC